MGILERLFPCRSCRAKDVQIESLEKEIAWARGEISAQNKRLIEIVEPGGNGRIALADRGPRARHVLSPPEATLPGFAPNPPTLLVVDNEG